MIKFTVRFDCEVRRPASVMVSVYGVRAISLMLLLHPSHKAFVAAARTHK